MICPACKKEFYVPEGVPIAMCPSCGTFVYTDDKQPVLVVE